MSAMETNYKDLTQVIRLANSMGAGLLVVKHENRPNYNITHASRVDLWMKPSVTVLHKT